MKTIKTHRRHHVQTGEPCLCVSAGVYSVVCVCDAVLSITATYLHHLSATRRQRKAVCSKQNAEEIKTKKNKNHKSNIPLGAHIFNNSYTHTRAHTPQKKGLWKAAPLTRPEKKKRRKYQWEDVSFCFVSTGRCESAPVSESMASNSSTDNRLQHQDHCKQLWAFAYGPSEAD